MKKVQLLLKNEEVVPFFKGSLYAVVTIVLMYIKMNCY